MQRFWLINIFNLRYATSSAWQSASVATGIKRAVSDSVVFTLQGDGDLAAIGTAEIIHPRQEEKI